MLDISNAKAAANEIVEVYQGKHGVIPDNEATRKMIELSAENIGVSPELIAREIWGSNRVIQKTFALYELPMDVNVRVANGKPINMLSKKLLEIYSFRYLRPEDSGTRYSLCQTKEGTKFLIDSATLVILEDEENK